MSFGCIGAATASIVDIAGEFYFHGALHFLLTLRKHEFHGLGQRERIVGEDVGECHYFASGPHGGIADYPVVGVVGRYKQVERVSIPEVLN